MGRQELQSDRLAQDLVVGEWTWSVPPSPTIAQIW
jgi:nitric oxide synthase oxygenase domain/subunit